MNWRDRFQKFMQGRYGNDEFSRFLLIAALIFVVVSMFTARTSFVSMICEVIGLMLLVYTYVRAFSRDIQKRYDENQKFLAKTSKIRRRFQREQYMMKERKTNHIYTCPGCGQKIRIPRGKGKIEISCPKCSTKFVKRS